MRVVILGSGTSHGVPVLGCACRVCRSDDPRDRRYRASAYLEGDGGERILIDAGPEFRLQALRAGIDGLDAALITHAHADHVHGLDDVRPLCRKAPLAIYASADDCAELKERFGYAFTESQAGGGKPRLDLRAIGEGSFTVGGLTIRPVPLRHGERLVYGYRVGDVAYLSDCSALPESSKAILQGLRLLVVDALRMRPHPTHLSIPEALGLAAELRPLKTAITHLCHDHSHAELTEICRRLAPGLDAAPAYDGQEFFS